MSKQLGRIIYVDSTQFQKVFNSDGMLHFLDEMHVVRQDDLLSDIESIFQNGSSNRSFYFMSVPFRDYASFQRGFDYNLPVYGVKGQVEGITRLSNYTELLSCKKEKLEAKGFTKRVFGTQYMTAIEGKTDSTDSLAGIVVRDYLPIENEIPEAEVEDVCMVLEKLWEAQEQDPRTRFIIRMNEVETRSQELLKNMYLMLPQELRLQLGFMTNIKEADLMQIQSASNSAFPLYLFTADTAEEFRADKFSFPVVVYDFERRAGYSYNQQRLEVLRKVAGDIGDLFTVLVDYHEKKIMEEKGSDFSSFRFYEEIMDRVNNKVNYWWTNSEVESVESLKNQYEDQRQLLNNEELHKEAMYSFLTKILPKSNLGKQISDIMLNSKYPNRQELISFLEEDVYQKTQISAMNQLKNNLVRLLRAEQAKALEDQKVQHENEMNQLMQAADAQLDQQHQQLTEEFNQREQEFNQELQKKEEEIAELSQELAASGSKKMKAEIRTARKKVKLFTILFGASAALMVAALIFGGVFAMKSGKLNKTVDTQKTQIEETSKELEELKALMSQQTADFSKVSDEFEAYKAAHPEVTEPEPDNGGEATLQAEGESEGELEGQSEGEGEGELEGQSEGEGEQSETQYSPE